MQAKEPWQSTPEEKLAIARHHKTKGTDCYKVQPLCTLIGLPAYLLFEPRCWCQLICLNSDICILFFFCKFHCLLSSLLTCSSLTSIFPHFSFSLPLATPLMYLLYTFKFFNLEVSFYYNLFFPQSTPPISLRLAYSCTRSSSTGCGQVSNIIYLFSVLTLE